MENYLLYGVTIIFTVISFYKDRKKTKMALKKAWKAFERYLTGYGSQAGEIFEIPVDKEIHIERRRKYGCCCR